MESVPGSMGRFSILFFQLRAQHAGCADSNGSQHLVKPCRVVMTLMYPLLSLFGDLTALCDRVIKAQLQLQHINNLPKVRAQGIRHAFTSVEDAGHLVLRLLKPLQQCLGMGCLGKVLQLWCADVFIKPC